MIVKIFSKLKREIIKGLDIMVVRELTGRMVKPSMQHCETLIEVGKRRISPDGMKGKADWGKEVLLKISLLL